MALDAASAGRTAPWPPWLQLALQHPSLMSEHARAWAQLLQAELPRCLQAWQRRLALRLLALLALLLGLGLGGVSLMLGAVLPLEGGQASLWLLWVVPGLPLSLSLGCWLAAARTLDVGAKARLRLQWQAECLMWQSAPSLDRP